jgi:hypothetical protein
MLRFVDGGGENGFKSACGVYLESIQFTRALCGASRSPLPLKDSC